MLPFWDNLRHRILFLALSACLTAASLCTFLSTTMAKVEESDDLSPTSPVEESDLLSPVEQEPQPGLHGRPVHCKWHI